MRPESLHTWQDPRCLLPVVPGEAPIQLTLASNPTPPLSSCVILGQSLTLSDPPFPHLYNEANSACLLGLRGGFLEEVAPTLRPGG